MLRFEIKESGIRLGALAVEVRYKRPLYLKSRILGFVE
jgi:hypothetical protein